MEVCCDFGKVILELLYTEISSAGHFGFREVIKKLLTLKCGFENDQNLFFLTGEISIVMYYPKKF
jgi:hypothetical protein